MNDKHCTNFGGKINTPYIPTNMMYTECALFCFVVVGSVSCDPDPSLDLFNNASASEATLKNLLEYITQIHESLTIYLPHKHHNKL